MADMVQVRWQQIRAVEQQFELEKENIDLRKQIQVLRASKNTGSISKKFMLSVQEKLVGNVKLLRQELSVLRSNCAQELSNSVRMDGSIKSLLTKLLKLLNTKSIAINQLEAEKEEMRFQLKDLSDQMNGSNKSKQIETERLRAKIEKLREELGAADNARSQLIMDLSISKQECDILLNEKSAQESRNESISAECKRLRNYVSKLEAENQVNIMDAKQNEQRLIEEYEASMQLFRDENEALKVTVDALEVEIERLNNAFVGNKSHFAKYVEVKTENVNLQSKLENISKKLAGVPSIPLSSTAASSTSSNAAKPSSTVKQMVQARRSASVSGSGSSSSSTAPGTSSCENPNDGVFAANNNIDSAKSSIVNSTSYGSGSGSSKAGNARSARQSYDSTPGGGGGTTASAGPGAAAAAGKNNSGQPPYVSRNGRNFRESDVTTTTALPPRLGINLGSTNHQSPPQNGSAGNDDNNYSATAPVIQTSSNNSSLALGVPIMSKQTRDSLKERVLV